MSPQREEELPRAHGAVPVCAGRGGQRGRAAVPASLLQVPQGQNLAKEEFPVGLVSHCWWQGCGKGWDGAQESQEGTSVAPTPPPGVPAHEACPSQVTATLFLDYFATICGVFY